MNVAEIDRHTAVLARLDTVARGRLVDARALLLDPAVEAISRHSQGAPHPNHGDLPRAEQCVRPGAAEPKCDRHVAHRQEHRHRCRQIRHFGLGVGAKLSRRRSQGQWGSQVGLRASTPTRATFSKSPEWVRIHRETELPRMVTDDSIERHLALLQREESSLARGAQLLDFVRRPPGPRPDLQHVLSMPGFCSQTAYIFAVPMLPDSDAIGSAWCVDHDAMPPCGRRVRALSHVAGSRVSRLSQASQFKRTSRIRRIARTPRGSRHTRSQRSRLIKWIARASLSSRTTRVQRSSRHPRTPRRERPLRRPMVCRVGGFGSASGFLDITSLSPPTGHLLSTSDKRTCITPLVTAFTTSRTGIVHPEPAHSCIADFFQIKRSEKVSAL